MYVDELHPNDNAFHRRIFRIFCYSAYESASAILFIVDTTNDIARPLIKGYVVHAFDICFYFTIDLFYWPSRVELSER